MSEAATATPYRHRRLQLERIEKFVSPTYFADVNLRSAVDVERTREGVQLALFTQGDNNKHPTWAEIKGASSDDFVPCAVGTVLGPAWSTHWVRVDIILPERLQQQQQQQQQLIFEFDAGCEALVWSQDGVPLQGLTGGDGNTRRAEVPLARSSGSSQFRFFVEVACNGLFGVGANGMINPPDPRRSFTLAMADIVVPNTDVRALLRALEIIEGLGRHLPEASERAQKALYVANRIINTCWPSDPATVKAALALARDFLAIPTSHAEHQLHIVGHCHIDTAWLWPYRETRRKIGRSWASQLRLMEANPKFTFACSQAQQYAWLQEDYPQLFSQVVAAAKKQQFVPVGATWVEMDCNIPNGESLVRQFLWGQRYYQKNFGERSRVFWLPDTFGYAAQLPQIMQSAGCDYFLSQKISWNLINKFPLTSFNWQGLDGTKVLAHFPPADTYNGQANVQEALKAVSNNSDRDRTSHSLHLIGNGDGGGGPQQAMLERIELMKNTLGLPQVKFSTPNAFFDALKKSSTDLETWQGELYLELHRGTYTTHAWVKSKNRHLERLLHEVELAAVLAYIKSKAVYPYAELERLWKLFLLQQFHDVIPGTSIGLVYEDVRRDYAHVEKEAFGLFNRAVGQIVQSKTSALTVFNSQPFVFGGLLSLSDEQAALLPKQAQTQIDGLKTGHVLVKSGGPIEPLAFSPLSVASVDSRLKVEIQQDGLVVLSNHIVDAAFDSAGRMVKWGMTTNAAGKCSLLVDGASANVFAIYEDVPLYWDAWDVELYHREKRMPTSEWTVLSPPQIVEEGPLRVAITFSIKAGNTCTIHQTVSLTYNSSLLRFDTTVDWNANRRILKVEHAMAVTTDHAVYETQFGQIKRPVHSNTSWDAAKFEVCGHRYAALCEDNFGIALLNNGKYGHSVLPGGKGLALSLLRSSKAPDEAADMGHHEFSYGLLPFDGTVASANVAAEAAFFHAAPRVRDGAAIGGSFVQQAGSPNVFIDTIKMAEDNNNAVVVRLYEAYGGRGSVSLKFESPITQISECSILEEPLGPIWVATVPPQEAVVALQFTPFLVKSLYVVLSGV